MSNTRVIAAVLCAMMCATESAAQSVRPSTPVRVLPLGIGTAPSLGATPGILPVIRTRQGDVEGLNVSGLAIFKGIPYAAPPVGDLRWRSPNPPAPWRGVRKAEKFGNACVQNPKTSIDNGGDPGSISEDCLYLNVWSPNANPSARLPVMVWIHGGALIFGSGSVPLYDGSPMARRGAVVVTLNYRLGQLGFFSHPALDKESRNGPVNFGLLDQIAALRWVQQNIAAFGGDAANVTILGESAGAQSVLAMFTSPLAKGLFRKGIAQSPYGIPVATRAQAREAGVRVADTVGLRGASATAAELRAVPADRFRVLGGRGLSVQPVFVVGDAALPKSILDVFQSGA
ncbi:MAG: carboxylesterase family protein, partial [Gemmatimonadaceae bacterium]